MQVLFYSPIATAVGWSLIHFLWQGTLVALATWLILNFCRSGSSSLRYAIGCVAMVALMACPVATSYWLVNADVDTSLAVQDDTAERNRWHDGVDTAQARSMNQPSVSGVGSLPQDRRKKTDGWQVKATGKGARFPANGPIPQEESSRGFDLSEIESASFAEFTEWVSRQIARWIPTLSLFWLLGVAALSLRLMFNWLSVHRLRKTGVSITESRIIEWFVDLKQRLGVTGDVELKETQSLDSPALIGWLRPMILLPVATINGMTQQQLEAVLAHELAHVRRADYLVNLLQSMIETLLFYHPAVWWVSRQIRLEREHCCDDLVIQVCRDRKVYIQALLSLEQNRSEGSSATNALAIASDGGELVARVARLLGRQHRRSNRPFLAGVMSLAMVGGLLLVSLPRQAVNANPAVQDKVQETDENAAVAVQQDTANSDKPVTEKMLVRVVDPAQVPIAGAKLTLGVWYQETAETLYFTTDEKGEAEVPIPTELRIFRLWAVAETYTPLFVGWEESAIKEGNRPPKEFTFPMIKAVEIGGMFVDENGEPIEGVAIDVRGSAKANLADERIRFPGSYADSADRSTVYTDSEGRWTLDNLPPAEDLTVQLKISHPDYISDENWGETQREQSVTAKELLADTAKIILKKGTKIHGAITDESGEPIRGGLVIWGDSPYFQPGRQEVRIGEDGVYEIPTQKNGELRVTVVAPGFAPDSRIVNVQPSMQDIDFVMAKGKRLEIHFVDEDDNPVPQVYVGIGQWRGADSLYNNRHPHVLNSQIPYQADEDGVFLWDWAPEDEVEYNFNPKGFLGQNNVKLVASDEPIRLTVKRKKEITGIVTDLEGNLIPSFKVIPRVHVNKPIVIEQRQSMSMGKDGEFALTIEGQNGEYSLAFEAEGFQTEFTEKFRRDDNIEPFRIQLKPATKKSYKVVTEDGRPLSNATILVAPVNQVLSLPSYDSPAGFVNEGITKSDLEGSFNLSSPPVARTVMVGSKDYYGEAADYPNQTSLTVVAKKWAHLDGQAKKNGKPWMIRYFIRPIRYVSGRSFHLQAYRMGTSDGNGEFKIKQVPSMPNALDIMDSDSLNGLRYNVAFNPKPKENIQIDFEAAARLTARVKFQGDNASRLDLGATRFKLQKLVPSVEIPIELQQDIEKNNLSGKRLDEILQWYADKENWDAAESYRLCFDGVVGRLNDQGVLSVDVLGPGKYLLQIEPYIGSSNQIQGIPVSDFRQVIEIKEKLVDLGTIEAPLFNDPVIGSKVKDFQFKLLENKVAIDDSQQSLSSFGGKYILLDFWCDWSADCEAATPKVQQLAKMLAMKGKATMISLKANGSGDVIRMPTEVPEGLTWIDGQLSRADQDIVLKELGVWTSQHLVLINPQGNFVVGGSLPVVAKEMERLGLK